MTRSLHGDVADKVEPAGDWLALSARVTEALASITNVSTVIAGIAPGAGRGAPGCFIPSQHVIEIDGTYLDGLDPATVDPRKLSDRDRYPKLWGLVVHEAAHAEHSHWQPPKGSRQGDVLAALVLEEARIEAAHLLDRPADRRWLRSAVRDIIAADFQAALVDTALEDGDEDATPGPAAPKMGRTGAAWLATLILSRADAGVLDYDELTEKVEEAAKAALGEDTVVALRQCWIDALDVKDTDAAAMIALGQRWRRALAPEQAEPGAPGGASDVTPGEGEDEDEDADGEKSGGDDTGVSGVAVVAVGGGESQESPDGDGDETTGAPTPTPEDDSDETAPDGAGDGGEDEDEDDGGDGGDGGEDEDGGGEDGGGGGDDSEDEDEDEGAEPEPEPDGADDGDTLDGEDGDLADDLARALADAVAGVLDREAGGYGEGVEAPNPESRGIGEDNTDVMADDIAMAAEKVLTGHGVGVGGMTQLWGRRPPKPEEWGAASSLAKALGRVQVRERSLTKRTSAVPPGRLRMRAVLAAEGQRAAGAMVTAEPFTRRMRRVNPSPPLKVGIMCDVSASMESYRGPVASAMWIVSEAVYHVPDATAAGVIFGENVRALTRPGQRPREVVGFKADDGHEEAMLAIDALNGMLGLELFGTARLLVIVSDGRYWAEGQMAGVKARLERLAAAGCGVLWLMPGDHYRGTGHVIGERMVCLNPAEAIDDIAAAAVRALQRG